MQRPFLTYEWRVIKEFPEYEMNAHGGIRNIATHVQKLTQTHSQRETEVVTFNQNGKRFHRTVKGLLKKTFPSD